jgi:hypothetical protein
MIAMLEPLSVGNAVRVILSPPVGMLYWNVLRNTTGTFPSATDPNSVLVSQGNESSVVDTTGLVNGTKYYYCAFYWNGSVWTADTPASVTPNATYQDGSTDALSVVRDRLAAGLAVEISRGALTPLSGAIQVLTAPPVFQDTRWPVVTVHLLSETPAERALGEVFPAPAQDITASALWDESEGWLARVQLAVIGWSQNPDERIAIRQALRRLVVANLSVFDSKGMIEIEFTQQDVDAVSGEYPANVYQSAGTFTCMAPVIVGDQVGEFSDVQVTGTSLR